MVKQRLHYYYTPNQQTAFLNVIDNPRIRDLFVILFGTGLRICELVGETRIKCITCAHLKRKEDPPKSRKYIPICDSTAQPLSKPLKTWKCDQHVILHGKLCVEQVSFETNSLRIIGKGDKERELAFGPVTAEAFKRMIGHRMSGEIDFGIGIRRTEQLCREYATKAGLPELDKLGRWSPHKMRHTYVTRYVEEARDMGQTDAIALAAEQAGHARIETTMQYVHTSLAARRKIAARMESKHESE